VAEDRGEAEAGEEARAPPTSRSRPRSLSLSAASRGDRRARGTPRLLLAVVPPLLPLLLLLPLEEEEGGGGGQEGAEGLPEPFCWSALVCCDHRFGW